MFALVEQGREENNRVQRLATGQARRHELPRASHVARPQHRLHPDRPRVDQIIAQGGPGFFRQKKRQHRRARRAAATLPEIEQGIEKGIPAAPRHQLGLVRGQTLDRRRQRRSARIVDLPGRVQNQRRRTEFFVVDQVAAEAGHRRCAPARDPEERR